MCAPPFTGAARPKLSAGLYMETLGAMVLPIAVCGFVLQDPAPRLRQVRAGTRRA